MLCDVCWLDQNYTEYKKDTMTFWDQEDEMDPDEEDLDNPDSGEANGVLYIERRVRA